MRVCNQTHIASWVDRPTEFDPSWPPTSRENTSRAMNVTRRSVLMSLRPTLCRGWPGTISSIRPTPAARQACVQGVVRRRTAGARGRRHSCSRREMGFHATTPSTSPSGSPYTARLTHTRRVACRMASTRACPQRDHAPPSDGARHVLSQRPASLPVVRGRSAAYGWSSF